MQRILFGALFLALAGCSTQNREGIDASCDDLRNGEINACQEGIITSCKSGVIFYEVCSDKGACEGTWQEPSAYRCDESDPPPDLETSASGGSDSGSGGSGVATGGSGENASGGRNGDGTGGSTRQDCSSSSCVLATAADDIDDLIMDDSQLYFGGCDTVYSIPKEGGQTVKLAAMNGGCKLGRIAKGGNALFFVFDNVVHSVSPSGGDVAAVVDGQAYVGNIAADEDFLFWVGNNVLNRQTQGGSFEGVTGSDPLSENLQVSGDYVYWSVSSGFERVPVAGGNVEAYATVRPRRLRILGDYGYVLSRDAISRVSLAEGGDATLTAATGGESLAVGDGNVYWTTPGGVMRVSVDGGDATTFDPSALAIRNNAGGIEADDDFVYWTDGKKLMKRKVVE